MSYIVAIPSFNRHIEIVNKTLKMLHDGGVPNNIIYIFVTREEEDVYRNFIPDNYKIVVGKKGITEQRKFIVNYFPENQFIVSIDDDVEGLFKKQKDILEKVIDLNEFFLRAFEVLKLNDLYIWGIYPVFNPFFMKDKITTDLKFIIGTLYGFINRKTDEILPSSNITEKEDYEQSIKYFIKDGGVVRFNDFTVKSKKHSVGGLGITKKRIEANLIAVEYLLNKYPKYVSSFKRANGMPEVRLKRLKKNI